MTKKTRYFLLAACVLIFLILAPLMVLYVRGISFNFNTGSFVTNGILSVRSVPNSAAIYLDGRLRRDSSGDLDFIVPGEHQLTLKKPGYQDWSKRLEVEEGQVTWANPSFGDIYLLFKQPPVVTVATGVQDFYFHNGEAVLLEKNNLIAASGTNLGNQTLFTLPQPANTIAAADASGKNFVLSETANSPAAAAYLFFSLNDGKFTKLSGLFSTPSEFAFSEGGQLYALSDGQLYAIDPDAQTKTLLFSGVKTFGLQDGSVYFIQNNASGTPELLVSQPPFNQTQTLFANLPAFNQAHLYITFQKQIFLLADNTLYLANNSMGQMAGNVSVAKFEAQTSILAIVDSGELDYFDPLTGNLNFVTRSSGALADLQIRQNIGYALFRTGSEIDAIELDTRDRQNQYVIYNGSDIKKTAVDNAGKNLVVLDGTELNTLTIR
ncbi:MAG: PEGA domain-containing protein [Candidatus Doudnabacteria bacterium]|nr:PEGA domain-containing protein [Candidatus Doudnabacteria bacterium]